MSAASISYRDSIRWLPEEASEPTQTIVLTAKNGVFLDVRFHKESGKLDWAFAGYRSSLEPNSTKFTHHIDSRTLNPLEVVDVGTNTPLANGMTLEAGEMVNPATGSLTKYEEVWRDVAAADALFVRNRTSSVWRARVGRWQLALGRSLPEAECWAWQAERGLGEAQWTRRYSTEMSDEGVYLPEDCTGWEVGATVKWLGESWEVLVHD
ncbi:hypothetical protein DFH07DRAFT_947120 [Mycena maculata]|uniref:Protein HRI1 n=1 Tax=Mycena maculata TaxID=230809 RepID=A0AAD7HFK4_9AGAR|nr:hypothetical protein DFH07DRAFT_947120 [Mycena maculata]